jgi:hypothetical protein
MLPVAMSRSFGRSAGLDLRADGPTLVGQVIALSCPAHASQAARLSSHRSATRYVRTRPSTAAGHAEIFQGALIAAAEGTGTPDYAASSSAIFAALMCEYRCSIRGSR